MDGAHGDRTVGPVPTREAIGAAFALVDGGPSTIGELAFAVCEVLGVDTGGCGSYELRKMFPYQAFKTLLERMVRDGEAVVYTRAQWREMSRGVLFKGGPQATHAYATADAARQIRTALRAAGSSEARARWELALHMARQRVLRERAADVEAYASAWMGQETAEQGDASGG